MILNVLRDSQLLSTHNLYDEIDPEQSESFSFTLGRSENCFIVLEDQMVSREHARITFENGEWRIESLSDFGRIFNYGNPVVNSQLVGGESLQVGPFSINVQGISSGEQATQTIIEGEPLSDEEFEVENEIEGEVEESLDLPSEDEESNNFESEGYESEGSDFEATGEYDINSDSDEDNFDVDVYDDDTGDKTQVFQTFARFEVDLFGEFAPYDKYNIESDEIFIGRNPEKCQIVLSDGEVSSIHATLKRQNAVLILEDKNSANGTMLNGERINKSQVVNGDEFIIGSTTFTVKAFSDLITTEKSRLMPVEENQIIEVEEIVEVDSNFEDEDIVEGDAFGEGEIKSTSLFSKDALKDPEKRKKILIIAVVLLGLWTMLDSGEDPAPVRKVKKSKTSKSTKNKFTKEQVQFLDSQYQLAIERYDTGAYGEAINEFERIFSITPEYKNAKQYYSQAKEALRDIEELELKRKAEEARKIRMKKVQILVEKARSATKDRNVQLAEALFTQILELDPENFDIPQFRLDLDAWKKAEERKKIDEEFKKQERLRKVNSLKPAKAFYNQKKWHSAILKLDDFLQIKDMDEDLTKEASTLLNESKRKLRSMIAPLVGKARSLKEGQDLKGAYEFYFKVLEIDPNHVESLNQMGQIRDELYVRSKKIYREAIISESLNLYDEAKEKFQEVQQVSPSDSEYYRKATDKLKNYVD